MISRARGCLIGLAVGDALGAAVEFRPPGSFTLVSGYRDGGPHGLAPGEWTDDTSMALALADSLIHAGWDLNDQAARYVAWYQGGKYSVNDRCFDIGNQTSAALHRFMVTGDAATASSPGERNSGNGSLMRLAPVVLRFRSAFPETTGTLIERAGESSIPTHASPICRDACRYLGLVLSALIAGVPREEALAPDWRHLDRLGTVHDEIARVIGGSYRLKMPPQIRGGG